MSALLRDPASVPALFSRNAEPERWADPRAMRERAGRGRWARLSRSRGLAHGATSAAVSVIFVLAGAPLVKAATMFLSTSLPR